MRGGGGVYLLCIVKSARSAGRGDLAAVWRGGEVLLQGTDSDALVASGSGGHPETVRSDDGRKQRLASVA